MREIKYKVYDKNKNKIFKVIRLCKSFEGDCEVDYCYYQNEKNDLEWLPLTEGILMQSIDMKDSEGNEIYEGDMLAPIIGDKNSEIYLIRWDKENCCFIAVEGFTTCNVEFYEHPNNIDNEIPYSLLSNFKLEFCRIIGNIYEHAI